MAWARSRRSGKRDRLCRSFLPAPRAWIQRLSPAQLPPALRGSSSLTVFPICCTRSPTCSAPPGKPKNDPPLPSPHRNAQSVRVSGCEDNFKAVSAKAVEGVGHSRVNGDDHLVRGGRAGKGAPGPEERIGLSFECPADVIQGPGERQAIA